MDTKKAAKAKPHISKRGTKKVPPGCKKSDIPNYSFDNTSNVQCTITPHATTFKCKINGVPRPQYRTFATTKSDKTKVNLWNVSNPNKESFTKAITQAFQKVNGNPFKLEEGQPVAITVRFYFHHPKKHYMLDNKTGTLCLSPMAPVHVIKTPDIDNCIKLLMDALQGLCCKNDCNIVQIDAAKQFDMTQTVWCEKSSKMGCTIIKITQFNENEFDANCNCLSCKHQMKTKSNRSSHKYTE